MNVLLINHYAGSPEMGMEYRPYYLAQEWQEAGHNVTIIAADNSHIRQKKPKLAHSFFKQNIEGILYIWVKTPSYAGNGIGRVKNIFSFAFQIYKRAKHLAETLKPDVVIASSTYTIDNYAAHKIAKRANAKYIYEVHDLWPLSPMELGNMSKHHPFIMLMQHGENYAYKHADNIISMLPKTQDHMQKHGLDLNKWHHIPNGINVKEISCSEALNEKTEFALNKLKDKTIIGYVGGHAISNSLDTIIEAARLLKNNIQYAFVFVGAGNEKARLMQQAAGLKNVFFLDPVSKKQVPNLLKKTDYLVISWKNEKLYRFGISPNKIFDYMMAAKPIIHAVNAPNTFVEEANCGIHVEPENPQAIADAIQRLNKMSKEQLQDLGQNGKKFVLENHDYKVLAKRMIDVFLK